MFIVAGEKFGKCQFQRVSIHVIYDKVHIRVNFPNHSNLYNHYNIFSSVSFSMEIL